MKPRFTSGEWVAYLDGERLKDIDNPKDYLTKKQEKDGIDTPIEYIESADKKIVIGYDYKIVRDRDSEFDDCLTVDDYWIVKQWPQIVLENKHDVRLIELAPLLAEEVFRNYHKINYKWHVYYCDGSFRENNDYCSCGINEEGRQYLLDELAKLYEGNTDEA